MARAYLKQKMLSRPLKEEKLSTHVMLLLAKEKAWTYQLSAQ